MQGYLSISACAIAMAFAVQSASFAQEPPHIGSAVATKNKVEGVVGDTTQSISTGAKVFSNEVVRTGDGSVADLKFIDETTLSVGPISEIKLDKFVYDPTGTAGTVVIEVTKGAFRFVTGTQDNKVYQIKTPYGTLGIRG